MILNIATKRGVIPTKLHEAEIIEIQGVKVVIHHELDISDVNNIFFDATHYYSGMNIPKCNRRFKNHCIKAATRAIEYGIKKGYDFNKYEKINK